MIELHTLPLKEGKIVDNVATNPKECLVRILYQGKPIPIEGCDIDGFITLDHFKKYSLNPNQ